LPGATTTPIACCSFCLKPDTEVKRLVAGPAVYVCDECIDLCCQIVNNVPTSARAQAQVEESLLGWVRRARALGATWAQVGDALGVTRQSAWERFAPED